MATAAPSSPVPHPYYPPSTLLPNYVPNSWHFLTLLGTFAAGCTAVLGVAGLGARSLRPDLRGSELATVLWFVLSGCIHVLFEGYYVYNFDRIAGAQDLFGQLWKEYAYSDSRYLTTNVGVLCMEVITVLLWGPLCFTVAAMIVTDHPLRYPLQGLVSLGQLYGDVLYYVTSLTDLYLLGVSYSRPERFFFWVYFVGLNSFWLFIPARLIWKSVRETGESFAVRRKMERTLKRGRERLEWEREGKKVL
ncbi:EBDP4, emopamil-binding protein [Trichodelitschia bisporula]|uniref:EBDP4, emopamil-binding protein n=1 Tax=Trichodelitschia bisporula TaxID=703511 RepID=A0A6G1HKU0_9PEZI|nr:EBDP4, emopamil-binding protein [Trichodelitschia bisporula]